MAALRTGFPQGLASLGTTVVAQQADEHDGITLNAWDCRTWRLLRSTNVPLQRQHGCSVRLFADGDLFHAVFAQVVHGTLDVGRIELADGHTCGSLVLEDASDDRFIDRLVLSQSRLFLQQSRKRTDGGRVYRWRAFDCLLPGEPYHSSRNRDSLRVTETLSRPMNSFV